MSINRDLAHLLVLPEDQANASIVNGFLLHPQLRAKSIQVLPNAGGWKKVVEKFKKTHIPLMQRHPLRQIVLLIDFDNRDDRFEHINNQIPDDLKDRVFILGVFNEPEKLKGCLRKNFEAIGEELAANCASNTDELWRHDRLRHNQDELKRMTTSVKPFLFIRNNSIQNN